MKPDILTRAALGVAASAAVIVPLAGCAGDGAAPGTTSASPGTAAPGSSVPSHSAPSSSAPSPSASGDGSSAGSDEVEYEDGTYTARGVYGGAPSYITVTVTLDDDVIADVDVEPMPENNDTSRGLQERFAAAVPDETVGRPIDEVEVGKLAGSSGTPDGFNDAIAQIRVQASSGDNQ